MIILLNFLTLIFIRTTRWVPEVFGSDVNSDQVIFTILSGIKSNIGFDVSLMKHFNEIVTYKSIKAVLILHAVLYFTKKILTKYEFKNKVANISKNYFLKFYAFWFSKITAYAFLALSIIYFLLSCNIFSAFYNAKIKNYGEDYFANYYVEPSKITHKVEGRKNLLLIYVESLETTLRKKEIFQENLIQQIDEIQGQEIDNFIQSIGANWTIAGMVASQCAIPLKPLYASHLDVGAFLPQAKCLGDILKDSGYQQYFLVGHDSKFGGMKAFYKTHGYQNIIGKKEWRKTSLSKNLFTSWGEGLHDDTLLDQAKIILQQAAKSKKPFNITIITSDTHFPSGHASKRCTIDEQNSGFQGSYKCSSRVIASFIKDLQKEGLLDNTVVLIMGDHLFMANDSQRKDFFSDSRSVYAKFIYDSKHLKDVRHQMTHFDVAPSLLDLLGFEGVSNKQFGLGFSVFSPIDKQRYEQILELVSSKKLLNFSPKYEELWKKSSSLEN